MATITIYQKPTCTTCRSVSRMLTEAGVDVETVNYYIARPAERIKDFL